MPGGAGTATGNASIVGWLVHHDQQLPVRGELVEQRSQLRFAVGQRRVMQPLAVRVEPDRVVSVLADVRPRDTPKLLIHHAIRSSYVVTGRASMAGTHVTTGFTSRCRVPISGPSMPPDR
ncbi:hypothetical protein GCM10017567_74180 [Amycolatopsis bullii]|uniref:Uncharacterized protein n=1 Tax=Amycolatopsis bullii TaxID=941987 RepID=A0ABQ3KSD7_9PSEU|nr:hypothetical protein GCM10017567_74180 [Amycolatopsis bullii]